MSIKAPCENKEASSYKLFSNAEKSQKTINFFNNQLDSYSTNSNKVMLVGGKDEEWRQFLENIGWNHVEKSIPQNGGEDMEELAEHELKHIKRIDFPITLKPGISSFKDVALHALLRQRLSKSTIEKHLRYARYMEIHRIPVDFRNPSFKNFIRHMDYREQTGAGYAALRHEWDAIKMFLRAYGIQEWAYKPPSKKTPKPRNLPLPDVVYKMMHHVYSNNSYENALYQYLFTLGFTIGFRVPSEICEMTIDDLFIDDNDTGFIIITETKKSGKTRRITPRKQILSSKTHKSFKNWINYWRPKVENQYSGNALFLWKNGKPVTARKLGQRLSNLGKQIWEHFQPYDMRRWCAIARLIETKVENGKFDEFEVCDWLGHDDVKTTMTYIKDAKQYYERAPYNWLKRVLKFHTKKEEENTLNQDNPLLPSFHLEKSDITRYGSTGI